MNKSYNMYQYWSETYAHYKFIFEVQGATYTAANENGYKSERAISTKTKTSKFPSLGFGGGGFVWIFFFLIFQSWRQPSYFENLKNSFLNQMH